MVDRANGVDDVGCRKVEPRGDARFAGRASDAGPDLGDLAAGFEQSRTGSAMDGAIDPTAPEHPFVGGVDDRVDRLVGQITLEDVDSHAHRTALMVPRGRSPHELLVGFGPERIDHEPIESELDFVAGGG